MSDDPRHPWPQMHPALEVEQLRGMTDREFRCYLDAAIHVSKFCPKCGGRAEKVRDLMPGLLEEWGCAACEPEVFEP